jgi:hypothetical protein
MGPTVIDPSLLTEIPAVTPGTMRHASRTLLAAAEEACAVAESLSTLADCGTTAGDSDETLIASERISRAAALLNEAQGALLFG